MQGDITYTKYLGTPYKFEGSSLEEGFDCINLCVQVARDRNVPMMNINHSHTNIHTYHYLFNLRNTNDFQRVSQQQDVLVVFRVAGEISHVGYMVTKDKFIHIMEDSKVTIESVSSPMWEKRVVGYYKYLGEDNKTI